MFVRWSQFLHVGCERRRGATVELRDFLFLKTMLIYLRHTQAPSPERLSSDLTPAQIPSTSLTSQPGAPVPDPWAGLLPDCFSF